MTSPAAAPRPLILPDGTPSKTGITLVPSATSPHPALIPVASTPAQAAELAEILDALPVSPERRLQMDAVYAQVARQSHDALLRKVLRNESDLQAKTALTPGMEPARARSAEEERQRAARADQVARSLGYSGMVRHSGFDKFLPGMGGFARPDNANVQLYGSTYPGYAVISGAGTLAERIALGGELTAIESALQLELNERRQRDRELAGLQAHRERLRQQAEQDYAQSPAGQIAALRAELDALKSSVPAAGVTPPASGSYAERMAALAAQGITLEIEPG